MPSSYIEDTIRAFTTQREKLRVELEQLEASAQRLRRPLASGSSPADRICDVKRGIAPLGSAVNTLSDNQMMVEKPPRSSMDSEGSVQVTFMSLAANPADAIDGRIQGRDVLDPAE